MDFPGRPAASVPAQPVSLVLFASQRFEIRFTHRQLNRLSLAGRNEIALIGCRFTDKPHEEPFIENYANAAQGSGQALLEATQHGTSR